MAIDWNRYFEYTYGYPADEPEPAYFPLFKKFGEQINHIFLDYADDIHRQIKLEAKAAKMGSYRSYIYFLLLEANPRFWPTLPPKQKKGLSLLRTILNASSNIEKYQRGYKVPPQELYRAAELVLIGLSSWAAGTLAVQLDRSFDRLSDKYAPEINILQGFSKNDFLFAAASKMRVVFKTLLERNPNMFENGHVLSTIITDWGI